MQTFWVVTANSWNGEHDSVGVVGVFDEATAKAFVKEKMDEVKANGSSYATTYECEEFVFNKVDGAV